jgi:RNA recognition motif-containing protein
MCAEQQKASTSNSSDSSQRTMKQSTNKLHIIRLRGLPFSATPADIKSFLAPVELPDGINSIQMVRRPDLRPTGEAYVHLSTETDVVHALNKHKQMMGKRYIEVCRVSSTQPSFQPAESRRQQRALPQLNAERPLEGACWLHKTSATLQTVPCPIASAVSHHNQQCF